MDLKKALTRQEVQMAFLVAWVVFPVVATLAGFYLGSFVVSDHTVDIQMHDIQHGFFGALIGLGVAIVTALGVTATYPKVIEKEYAAREAHLAHLREHGGSVAHH